MTPEMILVMAAITVTLAVVGCHRLFLNRVTQMRQRVSVVAVRGITSPEIPTGRLAPLLPHHYWPRWLGRGYLEQQSDLLAKADLELRAGEFIAIRLVCASLGALLGLVLAPAEREIVAVVAAATGYMIPALYAKWRQNYQRSVFERQLPHALQLMVNSLRAGASFNKSLEVAVRSSTPPLSKHLSAALHETKLGVLLEDALHTVARRVGSSDFDVVVVAYRIQRETGGNLALVLEKVAETVRQRLRLRGELRVLTAQGKLSGLVVGLLPVAVFAVLTVTTPDYFDPLLRSTLGRWLLAGAIVWQLLGVLLVRKIVNIRT
ncbi:MAG: secretion system protein [Verrucomicrobia bacterium]|nr:secretion system protein [Verrucomicrobiota bacterium]